MRTESPTRIALAVVLPLAFAALARAQEPEPAEIERIYDRDHAFSFMLPFFGRTAQLGVMLQSDPATDSIGARILDVRDDGPADAAGLRAGDIITAIDGRSIAQRDTDEVRPNQQLVRRLRGILPGDTVRLDYRRDGEPLAVNVIAAERTPQFRSRSVDIPSFDIDVPDEGSRVWVDALRFGPNAGLELADMNEGLGEYFGVERGALVIDVHRDSRLGLEPGDVILRIGGREVRDARHARSIVASYRDDEPVQLEIMRDGEQQTVTGEPR